MTDTVTGAGSQDVVYVIDDSDRLVDVNDNWDMFATQNEAHYLGHQQVLGRSLWDFIEDDETLHVHRVLAERARDRQDGLRFAFRCDSPSIRRYMQMQIIPGAEGDVTYRCRVDRIQHRAPILFNEQKAWRTNKILRMCSWCKKVDIGADKWMEIEPAIRELQLLERRILPRFKHTMCNKCLQDLDVDS